jgi:hypothetical protein
MRTSVLFTDDLAGKAVYLEHKFVDNIPANARPTSVMESGIFVFPVIEFPVEPDSQKWTH